MSSPSHHQHVDKTIYSYGLSESTMSTSSACPNPNPNAQIHAHAEAHELEPLTTTHRNKAIKNNRPRSGSLVQAVKDNQNPTTPTCDATSVTSKTRKISLPSTALLATEDHEPQIVCIETQNSDL